jgi:hypothetical protein
VRADTGEADLAGLLGGLLRIDEIVGDLGGTALGVEVPDIHVVGAELFEAGVEVFERVLAGTGVALGGEGHLVPFGLQGGADHAFVVALM